MRTGKRDTIRMDKCIKVWNKSIQVVGKTSELTPGHDKVSDRHMIQDPYSYSEQSHSQPR